MSRSFLFVPADSDRKLAKARDAGADALILDLEDSVVPAAKAAAREGAAAFLAAGAEPELWVRINPLDSGHAQDDLAAVMPAAPFGIVLPKPDGALDVNQLADRLDVLERAHGLAPGSTSILPIATERPAALFRMHEYAEVSQRLAGLTWGAEDLGAAVGAAATRDDTGAWLPPFELARSLCLMAASAANVPAIDTVFTDFRNRRGLADYAALARRDGFEGMLAIHPNQVPAINDAFQPTAEEVERAEQIVAAFAANPESGTLGIDGEMVDRPHLIQAERILTRAARYQ